ncbi:MAG: DUF3006 domain-containing protein [Clostridia bacterium]|nr:DUF3006 domain-containing protein [Clostridia bacterium]
MKLTLDRREGNTAVFVDDHGAVYDLPASVIPADAPDGEVFSVTGNLFDGTPVLEPDPGETKKREERVSGLFQKLKCKKRGNKQ